MKSFLTDCGLLDSLQLVIEGDGAPAGELRILHQPFALIGRDSRADVALDHVHVSRRHVYLQVVERQAFWIDLESRMGTRSDGEFQKTGWLDENNPLGIGPFVIRRFGGDSRNHADHREVDGPRTAPLVAVARSHTPLPDVSLEFLNGPSQAMAWPVRRVMSLIGSASGCKFRLTDGSVSRFHASLVRTSGGLWIVDLLGQGGISVNDVPLRFSHLADGDRLRIGRYQIRVVYRAGRQGSGSESPGRTRPKLTVQPRGRERNSNGIMIPDQVASAPAFAPGILAGNGTGFPVAIRAVSSLTKVNLPGAESTSPLALTSGELTESMLVPLVNQFGLMQQQMFDQFQQSMAMMVQMFGTMHRDQMAVIREELDRLNELTEEFHSLKAELANRAQEPRATESTGPAIATAPDVGAAATGSSVKTTTRTAASETVTSQDVGEGSQGAVIQPPAATPAVPDQQSSPARRISPEPHTAKPPPAECAPAAPPTESASRSPAAASGATAPAGSERDSVLWLHQRIMMLQQERETRWQKILKLLPGVS